MIERRDYPLGYSDEEAQRLADQAALFEDLTEDTLRRAGLRMGMRVLDLGCGVGDVSLLAARIVGPTGAVLGVDRAASSLKIAQGRAAGLGATNVRFDEAELQAFDTDQMFDAIIGRLVLLYLSDPAVLLRRLRDRVRPGGLLAFQEIDMSQISQVPSSALFEQVVRWIQGAFAASGAELNMGTKLLATFLRAGLPRPTMISASRVESGPLSPAYDYVTRVLRSLLPLVEQARIASSAEIGIDTLADRLRQDAMADERVTFLPRMVSAWSRLPAS
jgi:ubiquinone/menaquinone biosynthesis C-methylase UbiE